MSSQTRLFVGNIPENAVESDLKTAFSSFGDIINFDLKSKPSDDSNKKKFAFITLSATNYAVESCIRHFSNEDYLGNQLYVARARESFLERLQRERDQAKLKEADKNHVEPHLAKKHPVLKLGDKLNPRKRKADHHDYSNFKEHTNDKRRDQKAELPAGDSIVQETNLSEALKKKQDADKKRLESIKKKRHEFKEKQMIIKTGLVGVDKTRNKKIVFSDSEDDTPKQKQSSGIMHNNHNNLKPNNNNKNTAVLFDDDDSDEEVNFEIKKQFEGKKGQKVLDLQSRYKSDKRFVLDERFVDDDQLEDENEEQSINENENIEIGQTDEKAKQLNILQDVLGVTIKARNSDATNNKKNKSKMGMLRFDPTHPEHAKFLAPVEEKKETDKRSKKKKSKEKLEENKPVTQEPERPKIEVSKEQFYKVSETLKEAIAQPTSFSLRSLFGNNEDETKQESIQQDTGYIPLETQKPSKKVRNPLEPDEKNPFVYDSSDSETEEVENKVNGDTLPETVEVKAVWKENLFFSENDHRFIEGLEFFNKTSDNGGQKERRELKSLMKKRIFNRDRKNQMFQKKIGGKKKTMKKSFRRKT